MSDIRLTIDGAEFKAPAGSTILEAALANGIYIPHLCHHPDLEPTGVCRVCVVEAEGRGLVLACMTGAEDGMVVRTEGTEVDMVRRVSTELMIVNHHADCLACSQNDRCELQRVASYIGITPERLERLRKPAEPPPVDSSNPFFDFIPSRCILCGICVRTCREIEGVAAIDFAFRGIDTVVSTFGNKPWVESVCESCGECVVRCPVGALVPKRFKQAAREVKTTCTYCGVGCGIEL